MVDTAQNSSQDPSTFGWKRASGINSLWTYQGHMFPGGVATGTEAVWTDMLNELIPQIPGGVKWSDCFGYENRANVNDPSKASFHAYGLALDINSLDNANGAQPGNGKYQIKASVGNAVAAKYGMEWGGNWGDAMHFEIHWTPAQCAAYNGGALNSSPGNSNTGSDISGLFSLKNAPALAVVGVFLIIGVAIIFTQT